MYMCDTTYTRGSRFTKGSTAYMAIVNKPKINTIRIKRFHIVVADFAVTRHLLHFRLPRMLPCVLHHFKWRSKFTLNIKYYDVLWKSVAMLGEKEGRV